MIIPISTFDGFVIKEISNDDPVHASHMNIKKTLYMFEHMIEEELKGFCDMHKCIILAYHLGKLYSKIPGYDKFMSLGDFVEDIHENTT